MAFDTKRGLLALLAGLSQKMDQDRQRKERAAQFERELIMREAMWSRRDSSSAARDAANKVSVIGPKGKTYNLSPKDALRHAQDLDAADSPIDWATVNPGVLTNAIYAGVPGALEAVGMSPEKKSRGLTVDGIQFNPGLGEYMKWKSGGYDGAGTGKPSSPMSPGAQKSARGLVSDIFEERGIVDPDLMSSAMDSVMADPARPIHSSARAAIDAGAQGDDTGGGLQDVLRRGASAAGGWIDDRASDVFYGLKGLFYKQKVDKLIEKHGDQVPQSEERAARKSSEEEAAAAVEKDLLLEDIAGLE